jgi:hypothetical protein
MHPREHTRNLEADGHELPFAKFSRRGRYANFNLDEKVPG